MYNWLPVGKKNYDNCHIPCCPCCVLEDNETVNHRFQCPHPKMTACCCTAYETIKKYLTHWKVPQQLIMIVLSLDKHFCNSPDVDPPIGSIISTQPIIDAMIHQLMLDVQYFMRGFLPSAWVTAAKTLTKDNTTKLIIATLHL